MIITCPCGEKNFEVDSKLIPDEGRLLKCGTCDKTWFFNKNENNSLSDIKPITTNISSENKPKQLKKNKQILKENISNTSNNKRSCNCSDLLFPLKIVACTVAPYATASSGLIDLHNSLPPKYSLNML